LYEILDLVGLTKIFLVEAPSASHTSAATDIVAASNEIPSQVDAPTPFSKVD
jgi:hypothetical protein